MIEAVDVSDVRFEGSNVISVDVANDECEGDDAGDRGETSGCCETVLVVVVVVIVDDGDEIGVTTSTTVVGVTVVAVDDNDDDDNFDVGISIGGIVGGTTHK